MPEHRPQILFLAHRVPYPPNRGDRIRSFHLLQFLAERADVHLAFLTDEDVPADTRQTLERLCNRVTYVRLHPQLRWFHGGWSLAVGRSATEGLFHSSELKSHLAAWARESRFDAVFVFCSSMAQYLRTEGLVNVATVLDLVDVDSQKWLDYAADSRGPKSWLLRLEGRRLRQLESALADRVAAITVVTPQEADLYHSFRPDHRPQVLRNGVDLNYFQPAGASAVESIVRDGSLPPAADRPGSVVFVGALDYQANVDGVAWFCSRVWPELRKRYPRAVFQVVGSRPTAKANSLGELPGVELVGEVPDVRPYLRDATVVVVPLQIARGVQNKVLEALAAGKPTVVSPQALEGIDAQPNQHLMLALAPAEWVEHIATLFDSPSLRAAMGRSARKFVEQEYRWATQLEQLCQMPGLKDCIGTLPQPNRAAVQAVSPIRPFEKLKVR